MILEQSGRSREGGEEEVVTALTLFTLNEIMTFLTFIIVFPGFLPPKDGMEGFVMGAMFFLMSFAWWVFAAVAPLAFLIIALHRRALTNNME